MLSLPHVWPVVGFIFANSQIILLYLFIDDAKQQQQQ